MTDLQLVIMAAGLGSRYGGLKQMDEFGPGQAFLMDYAVFDAYRLGVRNVTLVVRESFLKEIKDLISKKWGTYPDLKFQFVLQDPKDLPGGITAPTEREKPWGTAHVLYSLRKAVHSPFLIMNADDFYGRMSIRTMVEFSRQNPEKHSVAAYPIRKTLSEHGTVTRGICEIKDGKLLAIEETKGVDLSNAGDGFASMNFWAFSPTIFPLVDQYLEMFMRGNLSNLDAEYQIAHLANDLLRSNQVEIRALEVDSPWFGVTHREDKPMVKKKIVSMVSNGVYPENLFSGEHK